MLLTTGNTWIPMVFRGLVQLRCRDAVTCRLRLWTLFSTGKTLLLTKKFAAALKQDADGTFPIARKLVESLSLLSNFDGYFINQETTGIVGTSGEKCANSCSIQRIRSQVNPPDQSAWYDAMTYKYGRYHITRWSEWLQLPVHAKEGDEVPADQFLPISSWSRKE